MSSLRVLRSRELSIQSWNSQIAFLKMYSAHCAQQSAVDAVQIFGGRGVTQSGMGRLIEHVSIYVHSLPCYVI